jgi:ribonucleoside-diphosphate reductase alpha chain
MNEIPLAARLAAVKPMPVSNAYKNKTKTNEHEYYDQLSQEKYRDKDQSRENHCLQFARKLSSNSAHQDEIFDAFFNYRFLPAGRVQAACGATEREVSPFNCSVSQRIDDCISSIMAAQSNAVKILRLGTGIGYNFSHLRPAGAPISKLGTESSGPLSFMRGFDVYASTIASSGHRRGAQMGIMNVSHPDIEKFIDAKMEKDAYRQFNLSVGVSDSFMHCVEYDLPWQLSFAGKTYKTISAKALWNKILRNAYESAEPGVVFLDRMNKTNNLYYCEDIEATNPCSEQPLPPYGLCTLGSFNLNGYVCKVGLQFKFNYAQFEQDICTTVEAYDNLFENAVYAIPEHKTEALNKRRIGLGLTGIANTCELVTGKGYGSPEFCQMFAGIAKTLRDTAYRFSSQLARERGAFPLFDPIKYLNSPFIRSLPEDIQRDIEFHGIRNSHLISYAPCGTISQIAWNVSSGVEPIFYHHVKRDVYMKDGKINITLSDFNYREYNHKGKTLEECSVDDHLNVGKVAQDYCDSAVSKTVNVAENCSYEDYSEIYLRAYKMGLKGITVFRPTELRGAVITKSQPSEASKNLSGNFQGGAPTFHLGGCVNGACSM